MLASTHTRSHPLSLPSKITVTEVEDHDERRRQILECHQQLDFWAKKLGRLLEQQHKHFKLAKLRLDASANWYSLSPEEKENKEFILAALQSKELPPPLEIFDEEFLPLHIRTDRDIFMARLHREDFAEEFGESDMIVPPPLCYEKDIMLEVVKRQPRAIKFMPDICRVDKDFLRAVLVHEDSPRNYLKYFSETLRSDPELMLEVFGHASTDLSMMKYCSKELLDDKDFFIQIVERSKSKNHNKYKNQVLQYASKRLQDDSDVVLSCIRQSPMNLRHASRNLRSNKEIVIKAGMEDGAALFLYKSDLIEDGLLDDRELAENILCAGDAPIEILQYCLEKHGQDMRLVSMCFNSENMEWSLVPEQLFYDERFLLDVIDCGWDREGVWNYLPEEMKSNVEVACAHATLSRTDEAFLSQILDACPALLSNRDALKNITRYYWQNSDVMQRIFDSSTIDIRNDKDIMMYIIEECPRFVIFCSEELRQDRDILNGVADSCGGDLRMLPNQFKVENPEVVIRAIEKFSDDFGLLELGICEELWQDRNVAMAWLVNGGEWNWNFPERYSDDEEMVLTAVKNDWHSFSCASEQLRGSKEFVMKVLAVDGRAAMLVDKDTLHDDELTLEAISRDARVIEAYEGLDGILFLTSFVERTKQKLHWYQTLQDVVVESMTKSSQQNELNTLSLLNQGSLMLSIYEEKIASYAGVLQGQEVAKYKAVCNNLAAWGL